MARYCYCIAFGAVAGVLVVAAAGLIASEFFDMNLEQWLLSTS